MDATTIYPHIRNREYMQQIKDFAGIKYGTRRPTDIDFLMEYHDRVFIFGEVKYLGVDVPRAQAKALWRIINRINKTGAHACAFVAVHGSKGDIPLATCGVRLVYTAGDDWEIPPIAENVASFVTRVLAEHG